MDEPNKIVVSKTNWHFQDAPGHRMVSITDLLIVINEIQVKATQIGYETKVFEPLIEWIDKVAGL